MNCNCISEIEIKLAKRYSEELGADASATANRPDSPCLAIRYA